MKPNIIFISRICSFFVEVFQKSLKGEDILLTFFTILHFLGASLLVGGEPLVALIAIKSEKDDHALKFFVNFLGIIAKFMWVGMGLALVGGLGMFLQVGYTVNSFFLVKILLYILVAIVSLLLLINIPKVQSAAEQEFSKLRENPIFKKLDLLSKIDMVLIFAIFIISVIMY